MTDQQLFQNQTQFSGTAPYQPQSAQNNPGFGQMENLGIGNQGGTRPNLQQTSNGGPTAHFGRNPQQPYQNQNPQGQYGNPQGANPNQNNPQRFGQPPNNLQYQSNVQSNIQQNNPQQNLGQNIQHPPPSLSANVYPNNPPQSNFQRFNPGEGQNIQQPTNFLPNNPQNLQGQNLNAPQQNNQQRFNQLGQNNPNQNSQPGQNALAQQNNLQATHIYQNNPQQNSLPTLNQNGPQGPNTFNHGQNGTYQASQQNIPQQNILQQNNPQQNFSQQNIPQQNNPQRFNQGQNNSFQNNPQQNTAMQNNPQQNASMQNNPQQNTAMQNNPQSLGQNNPLSLGQNPQQQNLRQHQNVPLRGLGQNNYQQNVQGFDQGQQNNAYQNNPQLQTAPPQNNPQGFNQDQIVFQSSNSYQTPQQFQPQNGQNNQENPYQNNAQGNQGQNNLHPINPYQNNPQQTPQGLGQGPYVQAPNMNQITAQALPSFQNFNPNNQQGNPQQGFNQGQNSQWRDQGQLGPTYPQHRRLSQGRTDETQLGLPQGGQRRLSQEINGAQLGIPQGGQRRLSQGGQRRLSQEINGAQLGIPQGGQRRLSQGNPNLERFNQNYDFQGLPQGYDPQQQGAFHNLQDPNFVYQDNQMNPTNEGQIAPTGAFELPNPEIDEPIFTQPEITSPGRAMGFFEKAFHSITLTKRSFMEKLGYTDSEVPEETKAVITQLQSISNQFSRLETLTKTLYNSFEVYVQSQKVLGEFFYESGTKETESMGVLMQEVGQMHRSLEKQNRGLVNALQGLLQAIRAFRTAVHDTLVSLNKTEAARVEFLTLSDGLAKQLSSRNQAEAENAQKTVDEAREAYNKLREDLATKVVMLNEKRVQALSSQLLILITAWSAYYANFNESLNSETSEISSDPTNEFKALINRTN